MGNYNNLLSMVSLEKNKRKIIINIISTILMLVLFYICFDASFSKSIYINLLNINFRQMKYIMFAICYTIILAVSLNLTTGCLGELVLGHAGFMAIGAYSGSLFLKLVMPANCTGLVCDLYIVLAMVVGFIFSGIAGIIVGIPALRLRGDYLAIVTLGFGQIVVKILELLNITGGAGGLKQIPTTEHLTFYVIIVALVVAFLFLYMKSRHGRAILSIREDYIASEACGINVTRYKISTFAISAGLAGIAGVMMACSPQQGSLIPNKFTFDYSVEILVIVVLGGLGSFTGSIVAAIVLTILPESLRFFDQYRLIIYSILLIIIMLTKPQGLLGRYEFSMERFIIKFPDNIRNLPKNFIKFIKNIPNRFKTLFINIKNNFKKLLKIFSRGEK